MAIDVLITPASGSIYISGSEAQTPTPPNLTNGSNYLWASGTTLQWGSQEVYTNTPGTSEITGGGSANQVAYYSAATTITGSANLTYDGLNLTLASAADVDTSRGLSINDNEGTETIRLGTSTSDHGLFYLRGATGGNAIYLDGGAGTNYLNAGNVGIGNTTAIASAKLTVRDTSDPQLTLAYDGTYYTTLKTDSAGDFHVNLTSGGTFNFGQSLGNEYFKFLRGNGDGIMSLRDSGHVYFDGGNVIFETASQNYFQIKGTNTLGFGSGADFSMSASGNVFYMTSGTSHPSATPILGIKQDGKVGIGTSVPSTALHLASATASEPVVTIENTNADGTPPGITFFKNTASPASSDQVGSIKFDSKEATSGDTKTYWEIQSRINDPTNTTPNGQLNFYGLDGDSPGFIHQFQFINSQFSVLNSDGVGPTIAPTGTNGALFKSAGSKMRLQAKSDSTGEIHMMAHNVGINTTSPGTLLDIHQTADDSAFEIAGYDDKSGVTAKMHVASNGMAQFVGSSHTQVKATTDSVYISAAEHLYLDNGTRDTYSTIFRDGTGEYARFKNARLGIGSTNPGYPLHVVQNSGDTYGMYLFNNSSRGIYFGDTSNNGTGYGKIGGVGGSLFLGATQIYTSFIGTADTDVTLGQANRRWGYFYSRYGQIGYSNGQAESVAAGGYVLGVSGNADRHPFMVKAYGETIPSFIVTSGSNVGIGTDEPRGYLEVRSSADDDPTIRLTNSRVGTSGSLVLQHRGSSIKIKAENDQPMGFVMGSTEVMTVNSDNTVGIGATSPNAKLDVLSATTQQRWSYDGTYYTDITVANDGDTEIDAEKGTLGLKTSTGGKSIKFDSKGDIQAELGGSAGTYLFKVVDSSVNWLFTVHDDGLVGLHGSDPAIEIKERASAPNHTDTYGKLWVKNDDPANLYYTDDDGNDIALTDNGSAAGGGGGSPGGSDTQIQFNNGGAFGGVSGFTTTDDGSDVTITSATSNKPTLMLKNTNTDGGAGELQFYKSTTSEGDGDAVGRINFYADNDAAQKTQYGRIRAISQDMSDGTEDGRIEFSAMQGGTLTGLMEVGYDGNGNSLNLYTEGAGNTGLGALHAPDNANFYLAFGSDLSYNEPVSGDRVEPPMIFRSGSPNPNVDSGGDSQLFIQSQDDLILMSGRYSINGGGNDIVFKTSNAAHHATTEAMRILGDGNVGIGATTPDAKLEVLSTTDQLQLTHTDASKYNSFHTDDGGGLSIYSNGTARANRKVFVSGNSIIMGQYAGYDLTHNQTGEHVIIGEQAGYELTGAETHGRHTIIGAHAVHTMTGGADSDYVTAIGAYCAYGAKPTKGFTALGPFAGYYLSGSGDGPLLLGAGAGKGSAFAAWGTDNSVTMNEDVLIGNGGVAEYAETLSQNTIVGSRAAGFMRIGTQNVAIGRFAMRNASGSAGTTGNIAIGQSAGQGIGKLGSADYNIAIGYENQEKALIGDKNIAIGYKVGIDGDNTETSILRIGNASGDYSFIKGDMANNNLWVGAGTPKFAITGSKVGIGQNNPSAKFHVTNDSSDSQWAAYIDQNNTGNVALKIEGTYGLGIETSGQFPLDISTASSADALRMLDNGNLGLGTVSPGEKLHVVGTARVTGKAAFGSSTLPTGNGISVANTIQIAEISSAPTHVESNGILWVKNDDPTNLYFTDDDDNDIALTNNGSAIGGPGGSNTQMQYNNNGALGGVDDWTWDGTHMTIATGSNLIFGDTNRYIGESGDNLLIRNSETGGNIELNAKNDMKFFIDGAQKLHMDSLGHVGIGLTNPQTFSDVFSVQLSSNSGWPIAFTNAAEDVTGALRTDQGDNYIALASKTASDIRFFYNDAEANTSLIIKGAGATAGNVGIGTTGPLKKLHVLGTATDAMRIAYNGSYYVDIATQANGSLRIIPNDSDGRFEVESNYFSYGKGQDTDITVQFNANTNVGYQKWMEDEARFDFFKGSDSPTLSIDTANARVGIGTTLPTEKLDVVGNIVASGSLRSIYLDSEFAVSGDNTYSMVSGSEGLALYGGNSYIDLWTDSANSRRVRFRAQASDGSFDAGSYLDIYPSSVGATGDGAANIRGNGPLTILTADTDDLLIYSGHTLGLSFDNELTVYSEADGNARLMMRAASVAAMEFDGSHDIHFKNGTTTKMTIETATGKVGIGTTAPAQLLHVNGSVEIEGHMNYGDIEDGTGATMTTAAHIWNLAGNPNPAGGTSQTATITLPSSPTQGDCYKIVGIAVGENTLPPAGAAITMTCKIAGNSKTMNGQAGPLTIASASGQGNQTYFQLECIYDGVEWNVAKSTML